MKQFALTIFLTAVMTEGLIYPAAAYAGGWTQAKGKGYFKLAEQIARAETAFKPDGTKTPTLPALRGYTTTLYGEFGLVDRVTLVGYMPIWSHISSEAPVIDNSVGIGDLDVGVRIGLLTEGPTVASLQVMAGLPLGDSGNDVVLWLGDNEFNQLVLLQVGHSFTPFRPI